MCSFLAHASENNSLWLGSYVCIIRNLPISAVCYLVIFELDNTFVTFAFSSVFLDVLLF